MFGTDSDRNLIIPTLPHFEISLSHRSTSSTMRQNIGPHLAL